jgi:hypothetical protein
MKTMKTALIFLAFLIIANGIYAQPLAFYKRALVTSVSRGPSRALYTTKTAEGKTVHSEIIRGNIDPLIMEYGLTDKIGIGFSRGGEIYGVNSREFYKTKAPDDLNCYMMASTKYLTVDLSYHFYVSKRIDLSVFGAAGYYSVSGTSSFSSGPELKENGTYQASAVQYFYYKGSGLVSRGGVRARLYYSKRFGLMAMAYAFDGGVKGKKMNNEISDEVSGSAYSTFLRGAGLEFGLCMRLFKQKGLKKELPKADDEEKVKMITFEWD